jgi:hypothetical protein
LLNQKSLVDTSRLQWLHASKEQEELLTRGTKRERALPMKNDIVLRCESNSRVFLPDTSRFELEAGAYCNCELR